MHDQCLLDGDFGSLFIYAHLQLRIMSSIGNTNAGVRLDRVQDKEVRDPVNVGVEYMGQKHSLD